MDYSQYLQLDTLLTLQQPKSNEYIPEYIFIITHQSTELWLKILLETTNVLKKAFNTEKDNLILMYLDKSCIILNVMIQQFFALKALSANEFSTFRHELGTASGMQSKQYHELNESLGIYQNTSSADSLSNIVKQYFLNNIKKNTIKYDEYLLQLKELYKTNNFITIIMEKLIEFDELLVRWRNEHIFTVKRIIGDKIGTGSSTRSYLEERINTKTFPEIWQLRNIL